MSRAPFCINPRTTAEKTGSCCLQFVVTACSYWYCSGNSAGQWRLCKPTFFTILLEICKHKLQYNTIQITIINSDSINCNKKVNKVKWSRSEGAINDKSHWQCVWDSVRDGGKSWYWWLRLWRYEVPVGGGMSCGVQPPSLSPAPSRAALSPVWTMWSGYQHFLISLTLASATTLQNNNTRRDRFFK